MKYEEQAIIDWCKQVKEGKTRWVRCGNICIIDNEYFHEMFKREWKMDDEMIDELEILREKINKIKNILS